MKYAIISCISIVLSILAMLLSWYSFNSGSIENAFGGVVGVFTLLISILIGWQIFSSVDLKGATQKVDKKMEEIDEKLQTVLVVVFNKNAELCRASGDSFGYLSSVCSVIQAASSVKDFDTCNYQIEAALEYVVQVVPKLDSEQIKILMRKLKSVSNIKHIKDYENLISRFCALKDHA